MKKSVIASILFVLMLSGSAAAGENAEKPDEKTEATIEWKSSWDDAAKSAKETSKYILLLFTDPRRCPPCRRMEAQTWPDAEVVKYVNETFVPLCLNSGKDENQGICMEFKIRSIPTIIVADTDKKTVDRRSGALSPEKLLAFLESASARIELPGLEKQKAEKKEDFEWNLKYSRILSLCGKHEEADERFKKTEELSKDRDAKTKANLFFEMASHAVRKSDYEEVEKLVGKVEKLDKDGSAGFLADAKKLYLEIANALARAKKVEKAKKYADKAALADKDGKIGIRDDARFLKAHLFLMDHDDDGALKILLALEKEVKDKELLVEVLNLSASVYLGKKDYDNAIARFEALLKAADGDKDKARVLYRIGHIHLEKEEYEKAIARYEEMHKITEDRQFKAAALYFIGGVYARMEKYDMAIAKFKEIIEKYPENPRVRYAKAQIRQVEKLKAQAVNEKEEETEKEGENKKE